jgi:hypothetical protein
VLSSAYLIAMYYLEQKPNYNNFSFLFMVSFFNWLIAAYTFIVFQMWVWILLYLWRWVEEQTSNVFLPTLGWGPDLGWPGQRLRWRRGRRRRWRVLWLWFRLLFLNWYLSSLSLSSLKLLATNSFISHILLGRMKE